MSSTARVVAGSLSRAAAAAAICGETVAASFSPGCSAAELAASLARLAALQEDKVSAVLLAVINDAKSLMKGTAAWEASGSHAVQHRAFHWPMDRQTLLSAGHQRSELCTGTEKLTQSQAQSARQFQALSESPNT